MDLNFFKLSFFMTVPSVVTSSTDQSITFVMECFGSLAGGWVRNFSITGFEYQTDVFIAWAGDPSQRCFTGTFQSFRSIFVSQLQKGQTTFICLFFNPIRVEDLLDHLMCCFTNTGCPFQKPCFIPFAV